MLTKLVSETEPRGNWCSTLVGDEWELEEERSASAKGPPMDAIWLAAHPEAQFSWRCCSRTASWWRPASSPLLPVDNFSDTSDDEFPGIEMDRLVAEFIGLAIALLLFPPLSGSWIDLGQSSKKCRNIWPSDLPSLETSSWWLWGWKRSLFSVLDSDELPFWQR